MRLLKSELSWSICLLGFSVLVGFWACASSSSNPKTQLDESTFSISGTWEIVQVVPSVTKSKFTVKITPDEEKLEVIMKKPNGEELPGEGTFKGKNVEWRFSYESMGNLARGEHPNPQTVYVQYKGKISNDSTNWICLLLPSTQQRILFTRNPGTKALCTETGNRTCGNNPGKKSRPCHSADLDIFRHTFSS